MTKRLSPFIFFTAIAVLLFAIACNPPAPTPPPPPIDVDRDFTIASSDYDDLSKMALEHLTKFEFDAWGAMLADTVQYNFPNGDEQTRTKLTGKQAVLDWWKNWQKTSGIQSMTTDRLNQYSLDVSISQLPGGLTGIFSYAYFSNKMVFNGTPVSVRMNFIAHFNKDKKIDRYFTYYDRQPIIEAMGGKNLLKAVPAATK